MQIFDFIEYVGADFGYGAFISTLTMYGYKAIGADGSKSLPLVSTVVTAGTLEGLSELLSHENIFSVMFQHNSVFPIIYGASSLLGSYFLGKFYSSAGRDFQ